jgi:enterochelin esterase-like enzyme
MNPLLKNQRSRLNLGIAGVIILILLVNIFQGLASASNSTVVDATDLNELNIFNEATNALTEAAVPPLVDAASSTTATAIALQDTTNQVIANLGLMFTSELLPKTMPHAAAAPTPITFNGKGTVEDGHFYSPILNRVMPYRVYMPPNYQNSGQRYPVLYMLHGLSGSYLEWLDYKLFDTVDALVSQGKIKPIIIVLPSGDQEYWVDHANGGPQYGEYVVHDVVGYIDATYRTLPNRENRAIGGHSMGGHGSLQLAFNHPDVFSVVGAHSPTLRTKDQAPAYFGDEAFYEAHDPVSLAQSLPTETLKSLKIWIDIGTLDSEWRPRAEELTQVLDARGIPHTWNEWEGGHAGEYWISHVAQYLQFYADNMSGK